MKRRYFFELILVAAAAGCSTEGMVSETDPSFGNARSNQESPSNSSTECPTYPDSTELSRACMFDSTGRTYREDGTLFVLPATPPYGARLTFKPGFVPLASDISSEGPGASVAVYAAPYNVADRSQCCAEESEANRIQTVTSLSADGELTITVPGSVPSGYQIAILLDFGALYRGLLSPAGEGPCDLPSPQACANAAKRSFTMRFYVGAAPSGAVSTRPDSTDPTTSTGGACLLSYNTALVDGDACCYRQGGKNQCDISVTCNDRSGADCCLIYGSEATQDGQRCCLYQDLGKVDGAAECSQLLAAGS